MPDMVAAPEQDPDETDATFSADPAARLAVGRRVSVRYRLPEGAEAGATDVVGILTDRDEAQLVVEGRRGLVRVRRADVIAAKEVPPTAGRLAAAHTRISIDDLELLMAQAWPAVERHGLGSWLLRASSGFTGRACSVLPVGDPTLPLDRAIDFAEKWYAERNQPAMFQLFGPRGFAVGDDPLGTALLERGYAVGGGRADWARVLVMTARTSDVPPLTQSSVPVTADARMSTEWLLAYGESRSVVPGVTESVLTGYEGLLFLSVRDESTGRLVAIARMATHPGWAGVFGVWVDPAHRGRGLATTLTSAIAHVAGQNAMPSMYLQVSGDNTEAIRLYDGLGFTVHHEYTYLKRP